MSRAGLCLAAIIALGLTPAAAPRPAAGAQNDLDKFMEQVLVRRDENWKKLQQYVLDEREQLDIRGPGNVPVWGEMRDYTWYLRDGFFVRSPVKVNGVIVPEADRRTAEAQYLRRARARDSRYARGRGASDSAQAKAADAAPPVDSAQDKPPVDTSNDVQSLILQTRQPEFIDSAYFLRFKFEPSKYALVGRESFEGRDVLRIEYYPTRLFAHEQDMQQRRLNEQLTDRSRDERAAIERMMNKVSLVTLWVEPASHQIVKYTFDNVSLDFLPAAWLVHMDDAKAVMTMSQPMPDVWLPRDVSLQVAGTLAVGTFDVHYRLDFLNYRQAETSSRFKIDK